MMLRRSALPLFAICAICLAVWQARLLMAQLDPTTTSGTIDTAPAAEGMFVVGVTRSGTLESADVSSLRAPDSGSTISYLVPDGEVVKKGQLVAKIDVSDFRFQVDRMRLEVQNRNARIEQERRNRAQDVDAAKLTVERNLRGLDVLGKSQQTELEQGDAQIGYDKWNVSFAETDYEKYQRLQQNGVVPVTQVEESEQTLRSKEFALTKSEKDVSYLGSEHAVKKSQAQADIDTAKFAQDQAGRQVESSVAHARDRARHTQERLEEMQKNLAQGELRADRDGVVVLGTTWDEGGRRPLREGDRIWPRRKVCDITGMRDLQVTAHVDESSANHVKVGQEAIVTVEGLPERQFEAKVLSISTVARTLQVFDDPDAVPNQRVFDVVAKLTRPDLKVLRPGMKASVQFVFRRLKRAVSVPTDAVFDRPGKGKFVYVEHRRAFEERAVKTGERNDEAIVIVEGLKADERVALSDPTKAEAQ